MKNKEIEELLNELKEYASGGMSGLYPSEDTVKEFVSYIEQLKQQDKNKDTRNSRQRVSNAYQIIQNDKLKRCFNTQKRRRKEEAQKKRLYKSRIDKAIEFIEEKRKVFEWYDTDLFYLESLLKGDIDE